MSIGHIAKNVKPFEAVWRERKMLESRVEGALRTGTGDRP